jgi:hypothetical protein
MKRPLLLLSCFFAFAFSDLLAATPPSYIFEGKPCHALTQTFQSTSGDAWYGLGQHQDGILNYRGQQATFFQNNTEVAIPFLVSGNNMEYAGITILLQKQVTYGRFLVST